MRLIQNANFFIRPNQVPKPVPLSPEYGFTAINDSRQAPFGVSDFKLYFLDPKFEKLYFFDTISECDVLYVKISVKFSRVEQKKNRGNPSSWV